MLLMPPLWASTNWEMIQIFFQVPMNISELEERFWKSLLHYPERRKATEKISLEGHLTMPK
jgi:hypothetical protein